MPTSTVKEVSGPFQLSKTKLKSRVMFHPLTYFPGREYLRLAMLVSLLVVCGLHSAKVQAGRALHPGCPDGESACLQSRPTLHARISIASVAPARIKIEAELPAPTNHLSFRNAYAGVLGLGERVETLKASGANGEALAIQKLAPGEFRSAEKFSRFSYEVNLTEPSRPADKSHVSWLNQEHGLLMLMDLLPSPTMDSGGFCSAQIEVDVPRGWTVASNAGTDGSRFSTDDPENAVFLVGPSIQQKSETSGATRLSIMTSGKWPFSDKEALKIARRIIEEYARVTRYELKRDAVVMLLPFPGDAGPASWSAETRGNDVVLLLGRKASGKRVLSRLGIVLSHELFHLWVPNSLKLAGDYDWFFEGFTLYQALRMDLQLGLISFDDYLETIARVYDSYVSSSDRDRLSLIEASERRWTTASSLVYEKGMLVALSYDLSLRRLSGCRESLDDVYRDLFRLPAAGQGSANETIINVLSARAGFTSFAKDYVQGAGRIDLDSAFLGYGIQVQRNGSGTKLVVARQLNEEQRRLLGCIGYRG